MIDWQCDCGCFLRLTADHIGALAAVIHLLRSPSRQLQEYGESFMRHHYHLRQQGAVQVRYQAYSVRGLYAVYAVCQLHIEQSSQCAVCTFPVQKASNVNVY